MINNNLLCCFYNNVVKKKKVKCYKVLKCFYNHHNVLLLTPVLIQEWMNHMPLALTKECHLCKIKCVPLDSGLKRLEKQGDGNLKLSKKKCKVLYLESSIGLGMTTGKQLCRKDKASTKQADHEPAMQICRKKTGQ